MPAGIPFFKYDWKKEVWNLFFVFGIFLGGAIAVSLLSNPTPIEVNPKLAQELAGYGITNYNNLIPEDIMNWQSLFTVKGFILMVPGGLFWSASAHAMRVAVPADTPLWDYLIYSCPH